MTGVQFKNKLLAMNVSQKELAEKLEMSQQSLSAAFIVKDVKSGLIERVAEVLGISVIDFYNEETPKTIVNEIHKHSVKGEGNTLVAEGGTISADANTIHKLLEELSELRKVNAKLTEALLAGYTK